MASHACAWLSLIAATVAASQPIRASGGSAPSRSRGSGSSTCRTGVRQKAATNAANMTTATLPPQIPPSIGVHSRTNGMIGHGIARRRLVTIASTASTATQAQRTRSSGSRVNGATRGRTNGG